MKKTYLLIISLLIILNTQASDQRVVFQAAVNLYDVDSMESVLPRQTGVERIHTLINLAASLSFEDFTKSIDYSNEALELSNEENYPEGIAASKRFLAFAYHYDGNSPLAASYAYEALNKYRELNDQQKIAELLLDIAVVYLAIKDHDKAMLYCREALDVNRAKPPNEKRNSIVQDTMIIYSVMGRILRMTGKADSALMLYKKYLGASERNNIELTNQMVHMGLAADCFIRMKEPDSAVSWLRKTLTFPEVNQSIKMLKKEHKRRIGMIYLAMGRADSATLLLREAYASQAKEGFLIQSQQAAQTLGAFYFKTNNLQDALAWFRKSEDLLDEELKNNSFYRYDTLKYTVSFGWEILAPLPKKFMKEYVYNSAVSFYNSLYTYYKTVGEKDQAMLYLEKYNWARDTLIELEKKREILEIQTKFETEQKESEIVFLSQENDLKDLKLKQYYWLFIGAGGLVILIVLFAIFMIRQNKLRNSQQTLLLKQRLFRTQMKPHFLFNSLSSIQNFILNKNPSEASDYLSRFSRLMREILNSSENEYVTLEEEVDAIRNYLSLQKIRYDDMFDYSIEEDKAIDNEAVSIPPMLAQPFIENAIEHGIKHKQSKGFIRVSLTERNGYLVLEIEDDGVGREKAGKLERSKTKDHKSMATTITSDRLANLNKKLRRKIRFDIIDLKDENGNASGTKVVFGIPLSL